MTNENDEGLCIDCNEITPGDFCPNCDGLAALAEARTLMSTPQGQDKMRADLARWSTR